MTSQLAPSPELAARQRNLFDALEELAANPESPYAFAHEATVEHEQAAIAAMVQHADQRIRDAASVVADRCRTLPPPIARLRVCERCDGTGQIVIGINPSDWTGGTELMDDCPECASTADDGSPYGSAWEDFQPGRIAELYRTPLDPDPSIADLSA